MTRAICQAAEKGNRCRCHSERLRRVDFPGTANLPIGDSQDAIQENGAPRQHQTVVKNMGGQKKSTVILSAGFARRISQCFTVRQGEILRFASRTQAEDGLCEKKERDAPLRMTADGAFSATS